MGTVRVRLIHPCDYYRVNNPQPIVGTCFVLMPFDPRLGSDLVYSRIKQALAGLMTCTRADELMSPVIMDDILAGIGGAQMIVADLTGLNPNVLYEVGIAHTRTPDVLLLARREDPDRIPFDLGSLRVHRYDILSESGWQDLEKAVRDFAKRVIAQNLPDMLQDVTARTERIVAYMESLLAARSDFTEVIIRHQAGFSSLSNMGYPDAPDEARRRYGELLVRERDLLIELVKRGAQLRVLMRAPTVSPLRPDELEPRLDLLVSTLRADDEWLERCHPALQYDKGPVLHLFSDEILFEGHKTSLSTGYGLTLVYTDARQLKARIEAFDSLHRAATEDTLDRYLEGAPDQHLPELRRAAIHGLLRARIRAQAGDAEP